jgi:hypothetical protein
VLAKVENIKMVRTNKKRFVTQWLVSTMVAFLFFVGSAFSQCDPDRNAYMYLHPAFAGKNWAQTAYDSILIMPSDVMCGLKPALFDICGVADSAVGVFVTQDMKMYMVKTSYTCDGGCTPCMLEYMDPVQIELAGIAVSSTSPLYLPKNNAMYGNAIVKVLFATTQNQVLALSVSVANQSIVKRDTLKLSAFSSGQSVVRILGDYDTVTQKDLGVWVLGSRGLMRNFTLTNDAWGNETKRDLAIQDTVFCVGSGYAGTSTGTIYKRNAGGAFVLDSKPATSAITAIYSKGAVGKKGTILEYSSGSWILRQFGTADYWYGNFTDRWDGAGVEVLDSNWVKTEFTYYDFPSAIVSTQPFAYANNMIYPFDTFPGQTVTVTMADPDNSYTDFRLSLTTGGLSVNLKNDGKYTILNIPGSTLCPMDSIRLKSGAIVLTLAPSQVQVSAKCMRGQYIPLCQSYSWMDYQFLSSHIWNRGDTVTFATGTNRLRIVNGTAAVTALGHGKSLYGTASVSCRMAGRSLVFMVTQGTAKRLDRIVLYDVKGQLLASIPVENRSCVTAPLGGNAPGIVCARYVFSDGRLSNKNIVFVR